MPKSCRWAFTLVELLVVIAIISVLASLLLPTLGRAKEKARVVQCISNFRQIGLGMALLLDDSQDRFPSVGPPFREHALGGQNPRPSLAWLIQPGHARPLAPYTVPRHFQCAADRGSSDYISGGGFLSPTWWDSIGCSYVYNAGPPPSCATLLPPENQFGISGQKTIWVPCPSSYIMMYEPAAASGALFLDYSVITFRHWHFARGPFEVHTNDLASDGQKFFAPVLFVDGHSAAFDFTKSIKNDYLHVCEPSAHWVWYKPANMNQPNQ
ncbi:MAG TPA: type II secretion system protein [Verrucomicrobiae bacterium]|nr:type II secretion system protein [Verrucomicrobiae bacterium]